MVFVLAAIRVGVLAQCLSYVCQMYDVRYDLVSYICSVFIAYMLFSSCVVQGWHSICCKIWE